MRPFALAVSLALACSGQDDTGHVPQGDADTDLDADSDTDADADADTDADSDSEAPEAGTYVGVTELELIWVSDDVYCDDGGFVLTVEANGRSGGWAACAEHRASHHGMIDGQVSDGVFIGTWSMKVLMGRHYIDVPMEGVVADGHALLLVDVEQEMASLSIRAEGWRVR